ncbi:MAG: hypothetical protein E8D46_03630 [Nitrospira sp.]|nr:MAG: hypothetical protein E8D46_03630 [Nitrospira sp.]
MERGRFETMLAHSVSSMPQEQNVRSTEEDQASHVTSGLTIPLGSRREARKDHQDLCSYEMLDATEEGSAVIEEGTAFALNRSTEGILLLMRRAPQVKHLIEVRSSRQGWGGTVDVFGVQWTKTIPVESFENLYLVGCRRMFGPCDDMSF